MKRLILFSLPTETIKNEIKSYLFPSEFLSKKLAYMPAEGSINREKYMEYEDQWHEFCNQNDSEFIPIINNAKNIETEIKKLQSCNILLVTGGNAFQLLKNCKDSGIFNAIKDFLQKDNFIYAGFSAGAMLLAPTISLANIPPFEENRELQYKDDKGLGIIDFEVFPHYSDKFRDLLTSYQHATPNKIKTITDEEYIVIDL